MVMVFNATFNKNFCYIVAVLFIGKKGNLDAVKEYLDSKLESFKEKYKEMNIEGYWTTYKSFKKYYEKKIQTVS
jgi:hypothetical protein